MQASQVTGRSFDFRRVGVRAVDDDDIAEQRYFEANNLQLVGVAFQGQMIFGEIRLGMSQNNRPRRRWPLSTGRRDFLPDQRIHQRTLSDTGPAERRHH